MYACLWIPDVELQAAMRWRDLPAAVGLVDTSANRGTILAATETAQEHAVLPGITSAQALARCPGICLLPCSPPAVATAEALLLEVAWRLSPRVEATAPGMVTIDLRSAPKGTCWQQLGEKIISDLATEHLRARAGFARHPDHAGLAARSAAPVNVIYDGTAFASGLPISALSPQPQAAMVLDDLGVRTVRDFLALPRESLVERLGADADRMWTLASARRRRALKLAQPCDRFVESFDFESPVETTEPLLFLLRRFLDSLCARVRSVHRVVEGLDFTIPLDDGSNYTREFSVPAPTTDVDVLHRILDTHLETLKLEAQPVAVRLELVATDPAGRQLALFERGIRDPNGLGFTLARLQAIVGAEGVGTPQPADSHRPGAFDLQRFQPDLVAEQPSCSQALGLPLRRSRPPIPAHVRIHDGRPAWIESPLGSGPIVRAEGPYRLSGDWWDHKAWNLEEWDVELVNCGLIRIARQQCGWTVEGTYDVH